MNPKHPGFVSHRRSRCGVSLTLVSRFSFFLLAACNGPNGAEANRIGADGANRTAVYARAAPSYVRAQRPDGTFKPETFSFKDGGNFGGPRVDATQDRLTFDDIAKVVGGALTSQSYVLSEDIPTTKFLIVVYWGTTVVPDDILPHSARPSTTNRQDAYATAAAANETTGPGGAALLTHAESQRQNAAVDESMEAQMAGRVNAKNANILGFTDEIMRVSPRDPYLSTLRDELEHDRYYVVLLAYDYHLARKSGERKLIWETRFSIPETGNDFEACFPKMASIAAQFFGEDTHGLIHHNLANTHVEVGEPTSLGPVPGK